MHGDNIMRPIVYSTDRLRKAFKVAKVMTLERICDVLGGPTRMTAFRKLAALNYCASYSHGGQYYTLNEVAEYDAFGLWSFDGVHFSAHGSLLDSIEQLVNRSPEGYFARELQALLHVRVHNPLARLFRDDRVNREQLGCEFLYLSAVVGQEQLRRREEQIMQSNAESCREIESVLGNVTVESLHALLSALNEKQRRLYLGFESLKLGHGGDIRIARISGVNVKTVSRGRTELQAGDVSMDRIRAAGAGRPSVKKNGSGRPVERTHGR